MDQHVRPAEKHAQIPSNRCGLKRSALTVTSCMVTLWLLYYLTFSTGESEGFEFLGHQEKALIYTEVFLE